MVRAGLGLGAGALGAAGFAAERGGATLLALGAEADVRAFVVFADFLPGFFAAERFAVFFAAGFFDAFPVF